MLQPHVPQSGLADYASFRLLSPHIFQRKKQRMVIVRLLYIIHRRSISETMMIQLDFCTLGRMDGKCKTQSFVAAAGCWWCSTSFLAQRSTPATESFTSAHFSDSCPAEQRVQSVGTHSKPRLCCCGSTIWKRPVECALWVPAPNAAVRFRIRTATMNDEPSRTLTPRALNHEPARPGRKLDIKPGPSLYIEGGSSCSS